MREYLLEVMARAPADGTGPEYYAGGLTAGQLEELEEWAKL